MTVAAGTRIGPYEIQSLLGQGGMGEVWCARDTRLQRDVAIKILPAAVYTDAERRARFEREARTLASLNHPHIAQIYGVEEFGGAPGLVMDLVEGPTLAERIARGPIAPDEALPIALQIADALDNAHERGIVHRDLKPANIKLRHDGTVKILDFGLAKAAGPADIDPLTSPTLTSPALTERGDVTPFVRWLPDGRVIYFTEDTRELVVVDPDSGRRVVVPVKLPLPASRDAFAVSRDGRTIYYGGVKAEADIWVVERGAATTSPK